MRRGLGLHRGPRPVTSSTTPMIRFDLTIELDYNVLAPTDFIFVAQPTRTDYQRVTWEQLRLSPEAPWQEEGHGAPVNRHLRVHAEPGPFHLRYDAIVD